MQKSRDDLSLGIPFQINCPERWRDLDCHLEERSTALNFDFPTTSWGESNKDVSESETTTSSQSGVSKKTAHTHPVMEGCKKFLLILNRWPGSNGYWAGWMGVTNHATCKKEVTTGHSGLRPLSSGATLLIWLPLPPGRSPSAFGSTKQRAIPLSGILIFFCMDHWSLGQQSFGRKGATLLADGLQSWCPVMMGFSAPLWSFILGVPNACHPHWARIPWCVPHPPDDTSDAPA